MMYKDRKYVPKASEASLNSKRLLLKYLPILRYTLNTSIDEISMYFGLSKDTYYSYIQSPEKMPNYILYTFLTFITERIDLADSEFTDITKRIYRRITYLPFIEDKEICTDDEVLEMISPYIELMKITDKDFGDLLGISASYVYQLKNKKVAPPDYIIKALSLIMSYSYSLMSRYQNITGDSKND